MLTYAYLLKFTLINLIVDQMTDPRKDILIRIYEDKKDLFYFAKGSSKKHHAWVGGYIDHIAEMIRIIIMFFTMNDMRSVNFKIDSAIIVAFFHDFEKFIRYGPEDHPEVIYWNKLKGSKSWYEMRDPMIRKVCDDYSFALTVEERNALKYVHGEGDDHNSDMRVSTPLGFFCNACDGASAGIWQNEGKGLG